MSLTSQSPVRDAITHYLRQVEILVHDRQRSPGTLRRLRHELVRVAPELSTCPGKRRAAWHTLGAVRLEDLDTTQVVDWFEDLQLHRGNASAVQSLVALRAVLNWVRRRRGLVLVNPAARLGLTHDSKPGEPLTPVELAAVRAALDEVEAHAVMWWSRRRDPLARIGATSATQVTRFLELTGARLREGVEMRCDEVQLAAGCVLRRETKTGPRAIPLGDEAVELLARRLEILGGRFEFVFPSPQRPCGPVSVRTVEQLFRRVCQTVGLDRHVHDLRHTYAWLALGSGTSLEDLSVAMGHASTQTTRKIYGRHNRITPKSRQVARDVERARHDVPRGVTDVAA